MAEVIGFEGKTFNFEDGKQVMGYYLYMSEKRNGVTGTSCDRVFISSAKLNGYVPVLGDEVIVNYNRYGKPQSIQQIKK